MKLIHDASKAIQQNDIPAKIIKANRDIFSKFNMHNFNGGISTARFPYIHKSTVFKKKFRIDKETDYRLVSILPVICSLKDLSLSD